MASLHYDIPTVFLTVLETLLQRESQRFITHQATQENIEPAQLIEAVRPHQKYGLPTAFWENFEPILKANVTRFIKSCAAVLQVDANKLIRAVMPSKEMSRIYIQQSPLDTLDCACKAFVSLAKGEFAARCFQPTIPGTQFCGEHQYFRPSLQPRIDLVDYHRLKSAHDRTELWMDPETGSVFDANLNPAGYYNSKTGKLTLIRRLLPST
jgi:hypothetical protein